MSGVNGRSADEILDLVDALLPRTNQYLAAGYQPFTLREARNFVRRSILDVLAGKSDHVSTMGITVSNLMGGATVFLSLGTLYGDGHDGGDE
jgi:hypothetical protein